MSDNKWIKIKCGKLYDGLKAELQENMEILIEDKYIKEVGQNLECPEGTEVIDLSDMTVTPGMIDAHVHPSIFDWRKFGVDIIYNSPGYRALATYHTAEKELYGGFTTVRCLGSSGDACELDVKRAINEGYLPGARLIVAPHLLGTIGSHGDMGQVASTNPVMAEAIQSLEMGIGTGPDFFTAAVRREKRMGADFIKIMATGGFATPNDDPDDIQLNDDELKAIMDTAKALKMTVTAHVYGNELMNKLLDLGIDGMEHGAMMDEATARRFEETGTWLVPTFSPYQDIVYPDPVNLGKKAITYQRKAEKYREQLQRGREVIVNSNIKLGYGTDFVAVHDVFESGWEYNAWLNSGCDPFRTLQAATKNNAEICGVDDIVGTLEPGKYADIAGWKRDLLTDPDALRDCSFVMKEGIQYEAQSYVNLE